ncbi:NAD(P)-dependent alcohol dehydrogenase [Microbacterium sp. SSM24]|uniref:NAD(P)-dependent alcohol dehydrogenase n=1 Tax=Microbacterium sp. SSM24 TaxID=2991714 RepID=UPI002227196E|nr:NAD(P)-dependent alcohol dehydrogenase [Microbacterium sp. SSM24]MCW3493342.1 NAD(P)-dependent alcohol dehydrogenase [Microbacterium sp. SSM24]
MGIEQRTDAGGPGPGARQARAATMRAVVHHRYGPPSVLESCQVGIPLPGRGEVLVQVSAASVHPGDYFVMTGVPYMVRLVFGLRRPRHGIPGRDLAGVVAAVGADVTAVHPGDEVFGWSTEGTLAEYACVPADHLAPVPAEVSVVDAAAVPTSALTALQALDRIANVQPGQTVLVVGASGGVGSFAVQIAKALGAEVTGVCSTRNIELVRSLGADHVVDYTRTDFTRAEKRYDVILDNVEAQPLAAVRRAVTPTGILIPNSGRGGRWVGPLGRIIAARVLSVFSRQRLRPFASVERHQDLLTLVDLLATGKVAPAIDRTYPLDDAADALRYIAAGHTRGKVVVTI